MIPYTAYKVVHYLGIFMVVTALSAAFARSDAIFNIGCAIGAVQSKPPGVYIAMNGGVFAAARVRKNVTANRFEHTP